MKRIILFKLTLINTILIFTGCSSKENQIKKSSLQKHAPLESSYKTVRAQPISPALSYRVVNREPKRVLSQNINSISQPLIWQSTPHVEPLPYLKEEPIVQPTFMERNVNSYSPAPYISPDIEFISYRSEPVLEPSRVESHTPQPHIAQYVPSGRNSKSLINSIRWRAKSFLGTPYVWGATGPTQFDCSGFTQWVYRDVGINIPRVSRDQARVGQYISYDELEPGDMVFFDTKKHRSGKVTHVGIYLGNHNFIHASSAGKRVVIYNFDEKEYYKKRFLWGRRVTHHQNFRYASN
jgi:hypothetical protein